jgi:hypothetical protein
MNRIALVVFLFTLCDGAGAVDPVSHGGKVYYKVDAANPFLNSGDKVCTAVGAACLGYTEPGTAVCSLHHPDAGVSQMFGAEASGVFCNGFPTTGICAFTFNSCITYPFGYASVQCETPISDLYTEMFVECGVLPVLPDRDNDGADDTVDNCPGAWNPEQDDSDEDGQGDACQVDVDDGGEKSDKSKKSKKSQKSKKSKKTKKLNESNKPKKWDKPNGWKKS